MYISIETMAQCIAVHAGARAKIRGEGPPLGFLLGTRHFRCSVSHFELGRRYIAECQELVALWQRWEDEYRTELGESERIKL